jgi:hypothetical protein
MMLPFPSSCELPYPFLVVECDSIEEAAQFVALLMNGDAERDARLVWDFSKQFGIDVEALCQAIVPIRRQFPSTWIMH